MNFKRYAIVLIRIDYNNNLLILVNTCRSCSAAALQLMPKDIRITNASIQSESCKNN